MFSKSSTMCRVLVLFAVSHTISFFVLFGLITNTNIAPINLVEVSLAFSVFNFFFIWFLMTKAINAVRQVTLNLNKVVNPEPEKVELPIQPMKKENEVTELIKAFNGLVDRINDKSAESKKILDN